MVYSLCAPKPIEDEAVVAELLVRCKGALQLLHLGVICYAILSARTSPCVCCCFVAGWRPHGVFHLHTQPNRG
jgi:16S rRNA C967 or C1407 C5-methylase (RsmB/RsmF family)